MLFEETPALEERILKVLVREPGAGAKRICSVICSSGTTYSLRGVYKELSKLEKQGVVFKQGQSYSIRLAWIVHLLAFAERAYERYTDENYLGRMMAGGRTKTTQRFNDLRKLDRLWTQLILALNKLYPDQPMFLWCPHQWFYLAHYSTVKQFYRALTVVGHKRYHIIGGDTYLDRKALKDLPKDGVYSFAEGPFHQQRDLYYTVIADSLITVRLSGDTTARIHEAFMNVKGAGDADEKKLHELFSGKVNASFTFERNEMKASALRKKFCNFFGLPGVGSARHTG